MYYFCESYKKECFPPRFHEEPIRFHPKSINQFTYGGASAYLTFIHNIIKDYIIYFCNNLLF